MSKIFPCNFKLVHYQKLEETSAMLKAGQENMHIIEYRGGVHNKKYSVILILLDSAINNFEDAMDLLSE